MGALSAALRGWSPPVESTYLPSVGHLERVMEELNTQLGGFQPRAPEPTTLKQTYKALAAGAVMPQLLADLPARHIRRAPWVILTSQVQGAKPLAANTRFLDAYIQRLTAMASFSAILTLAWCFLHFYPEQESSFFTTLRRVLHSTLLPLATNTRGLRFQQRARDYHLFDADGTERFARRLLSDAKPLDTVFNAAGLTGQLAEKGFSEHAWRKVLNHVQRDLETGQLPEPALQRLLAFAPGPGPDAPVRFPRQRAAMAEALLLPFRQSSKADSYREPIKTFVLEHYGDPRMRKANWHGVSNGAMEVVRGWLAENTLKDFFRLLDYAAQHDAIARRHWKYRRAFWSAYLKAGYISDAWVVLGQRISAEASHLLQDQGSEYGKLGKGTNVRPDHAALLLRIGSLVISEWSHNGAYRVWHEDSPHAPRLYLKHYQSTDIKTQPGFKGSHQGTVSGRWQNTLSNYIRQETGISLYMRDLMPR